MVNISEKLRYTSASDTGAKKESSTMYLTWPSNAKMCVSNH